MMFEPARFDLLARPGFNCGNYKKLSKTHPERVPQTDLFCVFSDVAAADRQMGDHYKSYMEIVSASAEPGVREEQRMWLGSRRFACPAGWDDLKTPGLARQKGDCLLRATRERLNHMKEALKQREVELASN